MRHKRAGTGFVRVVTEHDLTGYIADFGDMEPELSMRRKGLFVADLTVEEVKEIDSY